MMRKIGKQRLLAVILCITMIVLSGCSALETGSDGVKKEQLQVHFLDVGQADSTLIISGDEAMLIDAGNNDDEDYILSYLKEHNVTKLKYAVGTHSHEDHVGSMDSVIQNVTVEHIILPKENTTTKTYQDVVTAIKQKNVTEIRPEVKKEYQLGEASFVIVAPSKQEYSDTNDYSVGVLLTYGKNKFLFTGDASEESEREMMDTGIELQADVFQAGHHGSSTSNSLEFLKKVDPTYAVISCGVDNKYGHPHVEIVARFEDEDIQMYRTDKQGTIVAESNGKDITWKVEKSIALEDKAKETNQKEEKKNEKKDTATKQNNNETNKKEKKQTYILNTNSKKFHLPDCKNASSMSEKNKEEVKEKRSKLIEQGYEACKTCNP